MTEQALMRAKQVAEWLNLSERQVTEMARSDALPAIRVGGEWRFERDAIQKWLDDNRNGAARQGEETSS